MGSFPNVSEIRINFGFLLDLDNVLPEKILEVDLRRKERNKNGMCPHYFRLYKKLENIKVFTNN